MQFLQHGASKGEPGIYLSLEREAGEVLESFSDFGWGLDELLESKKLSIVKPDMRRFDTLKQTIEEEIDRLGAKRLVIDPFSLLSAYFNNVYDVRKALSDLSRQMRASGCTLLAVADIKESETGFSSTGFEEFVAGGIIGLDLLYRKDSSELARTLLIRKMARTRHAIKPVQFEISGKGIELKQAAGAFE
jgi:KaiC/GvpD/RAD55 family RecA-like ATPase